MRNVSIGRFCAPTRCVQLDYVQNIDTSALMRPLSVCVQPSESSPNLLEVLPSSSSSDEKLVTFNEELQNPSMSPPAPPLDENTSISIFLSQLRSFQNGFLNYAEILPFRDSGVFAVKTIYENSLNSLLYHISEQIVRKSGTIEVKLSQIC